MLYISWLTRWCAYTCVRPAPRPGKRSPVGDTSSVARDAGRSAARPEAERESARGTPASRHCAVAGRLDDACASRSSPASEPDTAGHRAVPPNSPREPLGTRPMMKEARVRTYGYLLCHEGMPRVAIACLAYIAPRGKGHGSAYAYAAYTCMHGRPHEIIACARDIPSHIPHATKREYIPTCTGARRSCIINACMHV